MKTTKKKTILVVYTNKKKLTRNEVSSLKKYSFNTTADVKVGDTFESGSYAKYKGLIEASGEVDISSQYGRAMQKVKRLQNEIDKKSNPQKIELGKKEGR